MAGDVWSIRDRLHHGTHLRLRGRVGTGASLLVLRHPLGGEVPIQIESPERRRDLDRDARIVFDAPFGEQPVEGPVPGRGDGLAANEQLALVGMSGART